VRLKLSLFRRNRLYLQNWGTTSWYAVRLDDSQYGIFDTFGDEHGRNTHLNGQVARLLFAKAEELFAEPPVIEMVEILASKSRSA
jgi:hypothetical protein